jgi:nucleoside-diphosphate-sugar epimerase
MSPVKGGQAAFIAEDLARVVGPLDLGRLQGSTVAITGGTGFVGLWLTELLLHLSAAQKLGLKVLLLARDPAFAEREAPHLLQAPGVSLRLGDVKALHELPEDVEWVVHAASSPDVRVHNSQPIYASQTIAQGTLNALDCATRLPRLKGFLNISSGYVTGFHSSGDPVTEKSFEGFDPSVFSSAYMEAKRYGESLCTVYRNQYRLPIVNVRPFSFVGPYQSTDAPWAVNNFIQDAVAKRPIRIQGDGTAVRSYMYGADMAWWLLNMLLRGEPGRSYNLGSSKPVTLKELAGRIAHLTNDRVEIHHTRALLKSKPSVFVPSTELAQAELGLTLRFGLDEALLRSIQWYS